MKLQQSERARTLLPVEHLLAFAAGLCDQIAILSQAFSRGNTVQPLPVCTAACLPLLPGVRPCLSLSVYLCVYLSQRCDSFSASYCHCLSASVSACRSTAVCLTDSQSIIMLCSYKSNGM